MLVVIQTSNMNEKLDYIARNFSRVEKKKYEHYVLTRIWHLLNDLSIKFVTQQYVKRPNGNYALTDIFFPQLKIHIEIDEGHHKKQIVEDKIREKDIINITNHKILRIDVTKDISEINNRIDEIIKELKKTKSEIKDFKSWDINAEHSPKTYIKRGEIDIKDDVAFYRIVDAVNCFGHNYKVFQRAGAKHPYHKDTLLWFPKLYPNEEWINTISNDENTITEKPVNPEKIKSHVDYNSNSPMKYRIVFARVIDALGKIMYRFKGKYELNKTETNYEKGLVWSRVAKKVKTYESKITDR